MVSEERPKVVKLRLTAARAQALIRSIAAPSKPTENVTFTDHAFQRMEQRGILDVDVWRILRNGFVDDVPEEVRAGDWKCKIADRIGSRVAGVVTVIVQQGELVIVTVEWEDGK